MGTVAATIPEPQDADRPRMQHGEAEASDPIMRRCLPTAERTMTRQVISAELTEGPFKGLDQNPRNKKNGALHRPFGRASIVLRSPLVLASRLISA